MCECGGGGGGQSSNRKCQPPPATLSSPPISDVPRLSPPPLSANQQCPRRVTRFSPPISDVLAAVCPSSAPHLYQQFSAKYRFQSTKLPYLPGVIRFLSTNQHEPVFLNVYGAQESIPRNEFRQPM